MNFASVLEKRYELSRFAPFYTNSFALIRESFALIREGFALIRESFALFRESYAFIRESYALIREKYNFFLYENEPNKLSYFKNQSHGILIIVFRICISWLQLFLRWGMWPMGLLFILHFFVCVNYTLFCKFHTFFCKIFNF